MKNKLQICDIVLIFFISIWIYSEVLLGIDKYHQHQSKSENNVKHSYEEYRYDVCDLVWCYLQYDRRKIAPIEIENILRLFDFRPKNVHDYIFHSYVAKDLNDYLSQDTKNTSISNYIEKTKDSWKTFDAAVTAYNSNITGYKVKLELIRPVENKAEKDINKRLENAINSFFGKPL